MKILLISFSYSPSLNPRAFRWTAIAEKWAAQGHQVDVLCERVTADSYSPPAGIRLHRVGTVTPAPSTGAAAKAARPSLLRRVARKAWRKLYWPDYACRWLPAATARARELMRGTDYDLLVSSSIPFTGHLVALAALNERPGTRWLVDIGDPFSFADGAPVNNFALYRHLNGAAERRVLHRADAISVTTPGTRERYARIFPFAGPKTTVIPPLLSPAFQQAGKAPVATDDRLRLVFVGTLYPDIRNPALLLSVFRQLLDTDLAPRLELHFYGVDAECAHYFEPYAHLIGRSIFRHGLQPRNVVIEAMQSAAALINIGNDTSYQLPSKVIEYAAMLKPVVNIAASQNDSSVGFFDGFEGIINILKDRPAEESTDRLAALLSDPPTIDAARRQQQLQPYMLESIAGTYLTI